MRHGGMGLEGAQGCVVTRWRLLRGEAHTGKEYNARNHASVFFSAFNLHDKISDYNRLIDYVVF